MNREITLPELKAKLSASRQWALIDPEGNITVSSKTEDIILVLLKAESTYEIYDQATERMKR